MTRIEEIRKQLAGPFGWDVPLQFRGHIDYLVGRLDEANKLVEALEQCMTVADAVPGYAIRTIVTDALAEYRKDNHGE